MQNTEEEKILDEFLKNNNNKDEGFVFSNSLEIIGVTVFLLLFLVVTAIVFFIPISWLLVLPYNYLKIRFESLTFTDFAFNLSVFLSFLFSFVISVLIFKSIRKKPYKIYNLFFVTLISWEVFVLEIMIADVVLILERGWWKGWIIPTGFPFLLGILITIVNVFLMFYIYKKSEKLS